MRVVKNISDPPRGLLDYAIAWEGEDKGLIAAWEKGVERSQVDKELVARAIAGELVVLPWKGGISKPIKSKVKYGSLLYIAMLQGLKGENLDVDTEIEFTLVCSKTNSQVTFTPDLKKLDTSNESIQDD